MGENFLEMDLSSSAAAHFWSRYDALVMNEHRPLREAYLAALEDALDTSGDAQQASTQHEGVVTVVAQYEESATIGSGTSLSGGARGSDDAANDIESRASA